MLATLKIIHVLSFALGIGVTMTQAVIGPRVARVGPDVATSLVQVQKVLGRFGGAAVVLLWITGVWMVYAGFGGFGALPGLFHAKLAAVVVLTLAVGVSHAAGARAERIGTPPNEKLMAASSAVILIMAVIAISLAVIMFK